MAVENCHDNQTYVLTKRSEEGKKNVVIKQNYVVTENGRVMKLVKTSWSQQKSATNILANDKIKAGDMPRHFQSMS